MPPARVLFVNHASRMGEAELVLLDVAAGFRGASVLLFEDGPLRPALAARGVAPILLPASGVAERRRDGSPWRVLRFGSLARSLICVAAAARRFDVLYANSQETFALVAPACVLARRKLVWHLHDILSTDRFSTGQIRFNIRLANRLASRVIVSSQAAAEAFAAAGGRASLLRLVPSGVALEPIGTTAPRGAHGLEARLVVGVFGRLAPGQGQAVALRALLAVPEAGCVIAGGASFGEDGYARSLVTMASELGVMHRVRFLGHRDDVRALMHTVDVVVLPSVEPEPCGRTLIRAMLARRPVVASNAGVVPEILDGGRLGLTFPPGDSAALAACLRRILAGDGDALIDPAERRARTVHTVGRMQDAIRSVIAELAA